MEQAGTTHETAIVFKAIGVIHSPHENREGMPIQAGGAEDVTASIEIFPEFAAGLKDLDGFSHIHVLYFFHLSSSYPLEVFPFLDTVKRGVFATRAPCRPNPIGLSTVRVLSVNGNVISFSGTDMLDGTPVLDIKPYVPSIDSIDAERIGWLTGRSGEMKSRKSDSRFASEIEG
ncbi:MAG: tRNA (N6-threonylcarbamoyladenosine(37)-N6)-methyltransferase TrmO [Candidatus Xenobiia bacterium LiM19]